MWLVRVETRAEGSERKRIKGEMRRSGKSGPAKSDLAKNAVAYDSLPSRTILGSASLDHTLH